jgi:hypothetical protein
MLATDKNPRIVDTLAAPNITIWPSFIGLRERGFTAGPAPIGSRETAIARSGDAKSPAKAGNIGDEPGGTRTHDRPIDRPVVMSSERAIGAFHGALCPKCTQIAAWSRDIPEDAGDSRGDVPKAGFCDIIRRQVLSNT